MTQGLPSTGHALDPGRVAPAIDPDTPALLLPIARALQWINRVMVTLGMLALLVAAVVLTSSVVSRYVMKASTDWQDEAAVFCLVGATFLCSAFVQSLRGHVGIEALAGVLPASVNRLRVALVDLLGTLFCAFFAWKSWTLFHEAWAEGQTTSSSWAPPLWIPYGLMAAGMTLLTLQLLVQLAARVNALARSLRAPNGSAA
jgi:TRAP-type C4-dicarboxylate transport system permease small subunit